MGTVSIRPAGPADANTIHQFIRALAEYEREPDAVDVSPDQLRAQLESDSPPFECRLAECDGRPVAFALFVYNYSTWRGQRGVHLEDLFVEPAYRGRGVGLALMRELARTALANRCARFEWNVLDWNRPAIDFYEGLGAEPLREWIGYRIADDALVRLAQETD